jgi:hypothetical protein
MMTTGAGAFSTAVNCRMFGFTLQSCLASGPVLTVHHHGRRIWTNGCALSLKLRRGGTEAVGAGTPTSVAALLGLPAGLVLGSGLFLLVYAAALVLLARSATVPRALVHGVVAGNLGWAAGCPALAALFPPLTALGAGYLLLQAAAVAVFAAFQRLGLARSTPAMALSPQRA